MLILNQTLNLSTQQVLYKLGGLITIHVMVYCAGFSSVRLIWIKKSLQPIPCATLDFDDSDNKVTVTTLQPQGGPGPS